MAAAHAHTSYGSNTSRTEKAILGDNIEFIAYPTALVPAWTHLCPPSQKRWLVLAIFSCLTLTNAAIWLTFAPITTLSREFFDKSTFQINLFAMSYLIMYIPGSFLAAHLISRIGVRGATIAAAAAQLVATAVRFGAVAMSMQSPGALHSGVYVIILCSQFVAGLAQPVFSNNPSRIAATWFPAHQRVLATSIAALSNPIGIALGQLLPGIFVKSEAPVDAPGLPCDFRWYLCFQLGAAGVAALLTVFFFSEAPPTPPSRSQHSRALPSAAAARATAAAAAARASSFALRPHEDDVIVAGPSIAAGSLTVGPAAGASLPLLLDDHMGPMVSVGHSGSLQGSVSSLEDAAFAAQAATAGDDSTSLLSAYVALLKIGQFRLLLFTFSLGLAVFNSFVTLTEQIIVPSGGGSHAGTLGAVTILAGVVGSMFIGSVLELTKQFKPVLKAGFCMAAVATLTFCGTLHLTEGRVWLLYVLFSLLGLFMLPLLPVTLETAVECTYPAREELSSGLLMMFGQIPAVSLIMLLTWCIDQKEFQEFSRPYISPFAVTLVGVVVTAVMGVLVYDGPYRRQAAEKGESADE